jgi:hypothetical protein
MGFFHQRATQAAALVSTILGDRLLLLWLPDGKDPFGKVIEEAIAAIVAVIVVLLLGHYVFSRPRVSLAWGIVSAPAEGPVVQLPAAQGYITVAATSHRRGILSPLALRGLGQIDIDVQTEPPGALVLRVERAVPLGSALTPNDSLLRTSVRCQHGGEQAAVTLRVDGSTAPPGLTEVAVASRLAPNFSTGRRLMINVESPITTIRW